MTNHPTIGSTPYNRAADYDQVLVARLPIANTSTAAGGGFNWVNSSGRVVHAQVDYSYTTDGTGTIDIGVSDDGTGSSNSIIDGGTMSGIVTSNRTAAGTVGNTAWFVIQASGTNNSIVATVGDTATSTAVGTAYVRYYHA